MHRKPPQPRRRPISPFIALLCILAMLAAACGTASDDDAGAADPPDGEEPAEDVDDADPEPTGDESGDAATGSEDEPAGDDVPPFYEGKTITLLAPTSEGGSVDTTTRFIGEYLGRHLEGDPTVIVENMPGGNQLVGANEYARREPDGTNLFVNGTSTNLAHILRHPDAEFDYADYEALISFPIGIVVMSEDAAGVEEASQLLEPSGDLIYGCLRPSGSDLSRLLSFELLELENYQAVCGYESNTALRLAIEQGEVTLNADSIAQYVANLADVENVHALFTLGQIDESGQIVRDPALPDLPIVQEVYEELHGEALPDGPALEAYKMAVAVGTTLSNVLWIHDDAPQEAKDALHAAIDAMLEDPDFIQGIDDVQAGYGPLVDAELEGALSTVLAPDEELVQWIRDFLLEEFDHEL